MVAPLLDRPSIESQNKNVFSGASEARRKGELRWVLGRGGVLAHLNLTPPTPQFASDVPANISSPAVAANPLILAKPNGGPETKIV